MKYALVFLIGFSVSLLLYEIIEYGIFSTDDDEEFFDDIPGGTYDEIEDDYEDPWRG